METTSSPPLIAIRAVTTGLTLVYLLVIEALDWLIFEIFDREMI